MTSRVWLQGAAGHRGRRLVPGQAGGQGQLRVPADRP